MSSFYEFTCYGCGGPSDTPLCYLCTCEQCGNILIDGTCAKCNSGAGNSFVYDPPPDSFNKVQSIFNPPLQSHYKIYLCQLCESNSHYGYECSQRVLLVYEPEPCYNQSFSDNAYPRNSPGVTPLIDHYCCYKCGDWLDDFFCNQCTCEFGGNGDHVGYNCPSQVPFIETLPSVPQQYLCCEDCGGPHETFQSITITFDLPTVETEDSLRMGDEHLDTILETESDEFIKSSVENLISKPSESEDESECDKMSYDNSSPRPSEELISENSDAEIESFSPSPIPVEDSDSFMEEIDLSFTPDDSMSSSIENDDYDSEVDKLIFEGLLSNNSLSFPENKSFHFDNPSSPRPPTKPPDDDSGILTVKKGG
uniref:Pre-mRNA splicing Prp18-interacting factor n=1 Tax=Tanacetum cinerariifolium TaxID=118510 RepID=A0A6L2KKW5_TANCI|nr:hypothetical protein [Tanacetum cinerariifolium]